jgi:hypothetical protein
MLGICRLDATSSHLVKRRIFVVLRPDVALVQTTGTILDIQTVLESAVQGEGPFFTFVGGWGWLGWTGFGRNVGGWRRS